MHSLALLPSIGASIFLILAPVLAFGFECVNGFHYTANAVATVIYTNTLRPWVAVVWSGIWNLIGVLTSSGQTKPIGRKKFILLPNLRVGLL
jgi:PiT family inorganic phosphate transporter